MLIANAIFFKGSWYRQPFSINQTKIDKFYTSGGKAVETPFMRASSKFYLAYADELDAKILRLPYAVSYPIIFKYLLGNFLKRLMILACHRNEY